MQMVEVIALSRSLGKETLSYFTSAKAKVGDIVRVPVRQRTVLGIVVSVHNIKEVKTDIRSSPFELKKIESLHAEPLLSEAFVKTAVKAARYFAASTGSVIASFLPKAIQEAADKLGISETGANIDETLGMPTIKKSEIDSHRTKPHVYIAQGVDEERLAHYRSIIREQFVQKKSVFFCVPTIADCNRVLPILRKGIEEYTYVIHGSLSAKKVVDEWKKALSSKRQILVIGTGVIFSLLRNDIGTIIIEKESSGAFKTIGRPHIDIRAFAEFMAGEAGASLVFGDTVLRAETLYRYEHNEIGYRTPPSWRPASSATSELVHMNKKSAAGASGPEEKQEFEILSPRTIEIIEKARENNELTFLYVTRRGLSPTTVCRDCETTVMCRRCSAAVVLHKMKGKNMFMCHVCGDKREADVTCAICGSWRLTTLGIGTELVEEVLKKKIENLTVFRLDKDVAPTGPKANKIISSFYNSPGSVLVGTDMAILYLDKQIENSIIVSLDSLFAIPDFRTHEKIITTISRLRTNTTRKMVLQTRTEGEKILEWALQGNILEYWKHEIAERKTFGYPPFSLFIKITHQGSREGARAEMEKVRALIAPHELSVFPAFIETVRGRFALNGLVKVRPEEWPNDELLEKLRSLPPSISVTVDPENIL